MNNITIYKLQCSEEIHFYCQTSDGQLYIWVKEPISPHHLHWLLIESQQPQPVSSNKLEFLLATGVDWDVAIDHLRWTKLVNSFKRGSKSI